MKETTATSTTAAKFVAYYRVSTRRQNLGLEAQQNTVANYCKVYGGSVVAEYSEKESAKASNMNNRTALQSAIAECKKQHAALIVAKLDRLSRDVEQTFHLFNSGIQIVVAEYPELDTIQLSIFSGFAQHEREMISARTKAALQAKKAKGAKLGSLNGKSNCFTAESAAVMRERNSAAARTNKNSIRAWNRIQQLMPECNAVKIAEILNIEGFDTPTGKGVWFPTQVRRLIARNTQA